MVEHSSKDAGPFLKFIHQHPILTGCILFAGTLKNSSAKRGAPRAVTSKSQILQLQEKIRLQKELLAMQGSQNVASSALVPFGFSPRAASSVSQSLAAIQAPPGGMMGLLSMIQAMVTQAMQGALQTGTPSSVATSQTPRNISGPTNKYNTPKTLVRNLCITCRTILD
jgi:hypothetical protein